MSESLCATCLHNYTRNMVPKQPVCCLHLDRGLSPGWPRHGGVLRRNGREVKCGRYPAEPELKIVE